VSPSTIAEGASRATDRLLVAQAEPMSRHGRLLSWRQFFGRVAGSNLATRSFGSVASAMSKSLGAWLGSRFTKNSRAANALDVASGVEAFDSGKG